MVDPIDGTVNYLYGIPSYAVSVAAVVGDPSTAGGWRPVAGAVVNPVTGEVFHARLGGGAHVAGGRGVPAQGQRLAVSGVTTLGQALTGTGFGYTPEARRGRGPSRRRAAGHARHPPHRQRGPRPLCGGRGHPRLLLRAGLNPWDMAAAWLVVTEAGGLVTGLAGRAGRRDGRAGRACTPSC